MHPAHKFLPKLNLPVKRSLLIPVPGGVGVPKIIHQTFRDKHLPLELEENVKQLKRLNPEWEYRLYDDNDVVNFIKNNYGASILNYFDRIGKNYGAARADLFRYLLMYRCGGVYLDIKSSADKPFDDVLTDNDQYLLSHWSNRQGEEFESWGMYDELKDLTRGEFQQWFIACAPGHPFLKEVIESVLINLEKYNPAFHGVGKTGVLRLTGPIAYSLAISRIMSNQKYRLADSRFDLGLRYSIYKSVSHIKIFEKHYSELDEPIVNLSFSKAQLSKLIYGLRLVKKLLSQSK